MLRYTSYTQCDKPTAECLENMDNFSGYFEVINLYMSRPQGFSVLMETAISRSTTSNYKDKIEKIVVLINKNSKLIA